MKYYTDNLAYDFNMFLPKEKRQEEIPESRRAENIIKLPDMSGKAGAVRQKREANRTHVFAFVTSLLIIAMVCSTIFLRVQVTETESRIDAAQKQLSELESEETRLQMAIERKISFSNIEAAAAELGMQKKDRSQVNYIHSGGESWAEVVGGTTAAEN